MGLFSTTLDTIFPNHPLFMAQRKEGVEQKNKEAEKKERKKNTYRSIYKTEAVLFKVPPKVSNPVVYTTKEGESLTYHQHGIGMRPAKNHSGKEPMTTWFNRHFFSEGLTVQPDSWVVGRLEIIEKTRPARPEKNWDEAIFTILCLTPEVFVCNNRPGLTKVEVTEKVQELGYEKWRVVQIRNENAPISEAGETFQILSCSVPMNHEIVIKEVVKEVIPAEEPPTEV